MIRFFRELARRALVGVVIGIVIVLVPISAELWPLAAAVHVPLGVLFLVLAIGKALYDTLFFDRY